MKYILTAGAFLRPKWRRDFEAAVFNGYVESWREVKGFLESDFHVVTRTGVSLELVAPQDKG